MMVIMITWSVSFSSSSSSSSSDDDDDDDDVNLVQEEEEEEEVDPSLPVQLRSVADHIEDLQEVARDFDRIGGNIEKTLYAGECSSGQVSIHCR